MTTVHHTQACRLPKIKAHQRQLKVREAYHSYQLNQNQRTPVGEIHLKGKWLIQAGFEIDIPVKVRVMEGFLVLTTDI
jgi:toxic protein SymE